MVSPSFNQLRNIIGHKYLEGVLSKELLYIVIRKERSENHNGFRKTHYLCVRKGDESELMRLIYQIEEHGGDWKVTHVEDEDDVVIIDEAEMKEHRRKARQAISDRTSKPKEYTLMGEIEAFGTW